MKIFRFSFLLTSIIAFCIISSHPLFAMDGDTLAKRVYDRDDGNDSQAKISMLLIDKHNNKRLRTLITATRKYGQVRKTFIRFTAPADIDGTAFLIWENKDRDDDQFLYLPALKRVRRIVSTQKASSFVNTDYTYEDMQRRKPDIDRHRIIGEEKLLGRDCWILESIPKNPKDSQYKKLKSWIAKDIFLPLKTEYYGKKDQLIKEFHAIRVEQVDGIWTVVESEMRDVKKNHRTLLKTDDIRFNHGVEDRVFTEAYLLHGE